MDEMVGMVEMERTGTTVTRERTERRERRGNQASKVPLVPLVRPVGVWSTPGGGGPPAQTQELNCSTRESQLGVITIIKEEEVTISVYQRNQSIQTNKQLVLLVTNCTELSLSHGVHDLITMPHVPCATYQQG